VLSSIYIPYSQQQSNIMDAAHASIGILIVFVIGYILIIAEAFTHINKASVALMTAVVSWGLVFSDYSVPYSDHLQQFYHHVASVSELIFFLLAAVTIVEILSAHNSFRFLSNLVTARSKRKLLVVVSIMSFLLSSVLDNLTTTVVMITLMRKIVGSKQDRWMIGSGIVIAANAGGAWTPIGDVTTTMLWIGDLITTGPTLQWLFLPSATCVLTSVAVLAFSLEGSLPEVDQSHATVKKEPRSRLIFFLGMGVLVSVPVVKYYTGLPPFMGMILGLSILWTFTDIIHGRYDSREHLRVPFILRAVDMSAPLFFLGVLLSVAGLETAGILGALAETLNDVFPSINLLTVFIGIVSAVIDNVPLVAACMNMYGQAVYPTDSPFWQLLAYCAGTGGSILIIGSAAGVAFMTLEKVPFFWYLRRAAPAALVGYFAGFAVYILFGR